MFVARRRGCHVVLHVHGGGFDEFYSKSSLFARAAIRWGLRHADCAIALSRSWKKRLLAIAPSARMTIVENAVEPGDPQSDERYDGVCRFLFVGKLDRSKGIEELLAACEKLVAGDVRFELTIVGPMGDMGSASAMESQLASRNLTKHVRYVGVLEGERKEKAFQEADVFVLPSHYEGMPISILEAMANGLSIIATTVGGIPEMIEQDCEGLLVQPQCASALANAMRTVANDPDLRAGLSRAALRTSCDRFSMGRFEKDITNLYDGLLCRGSTVSAKEYDFVMGILPQSPTRKDSMASRP